jgi:predicted transposase/invertase (TIGR01784 family)
MTEKRNPLSPRNNYFFKRIFGDIKNKDILTDFLKAALDIPLDEYDDVEIINPESSVEYIDDKYNILDIKLHTKSGKVIDVEIQRNIKKAFRQRIVYQESKLIEEQLCSGEDYSKVHPAICIVITEFVLIRENDAYHNRYEYYDKRTGSTFSDIACIHIFELAKLPDSDVRDDDPLLDWLRFLNCDEEESMEMIANKNEGVRRAVARYKELTADERERMIAEAVEKQRRDRVAELEYAKEEGLAEGQAKGRVDEQCEIARRMKAEGLDPSLISKVTGLPQEEILELIALSRNKGI